MSTLSFSQQQDNADLIALNGTPAEIAQQTVAPGLPVRPAPTIPYQAVFYQRDDPALQLSALLGDTPPTPSMPAGDWTVVALPKRSAVTVWQGRQNLMRMSVPIILGSMLEGQQPPGAEQSALLRAWRPLDDTHEPPPVKVISQGSAVPYQSLAWVVDEIQWGDAQANPQARRLMQKLTVVLLEYRPDEKLQADHAKRAAARPRTRMHAVKAGETLVTIARALHVKGGWRTIGDAQHPPIHDPRRIHAGQRLVIPG